MIWSLYFRSIAHAVALNSKCLSIKIGAIIVKDNSIICTGYNGPPRNVPECDRRWEFDKNLKPFLDRRETIPRCPRRILGFASGEGLNLCIAAHAEANCIANAARHGIELVNTSMYMTCGVPCKNCLALIINAGISHIICEDKIFYDTESEYLVSYSLLNVSTYKEIGGSQ